MVNPINLHLTVDSSFDWVALIAAVASLIAGYIGGLTYRWDRRRHKRLAMVQRFRLMQKLLSLITVGIQRLSEGYNSDELKTMVDAINILNDSFMNALHEILPEFLDTTEDLLSFALNLWDESKEIREHYARSIHDSNPSQLWSDDTEGVARITITHTLSLLATKYRDLSDIQAREIDNIRPIPPRG